ncbi:MAG: amidase family protein [Vicinamibacterales bacterium]
MLKPLRSRLVLVALVAGVLLPALALAQARTLDVDQATIADIAKALDAGTLTVEQLVGMSLARIKAYDEQGPKLNAIITLNPKALETARALDAELKAGHRRSPLHGIPVVLKDNFDTADMPTTGGSVLLEGSLPPDDAFVVKKLRDAGAIILAKVNMSEFASGSTHSSLGGQSLNPHDLARSPSGSSGGTGVSVAAGYAPLGFGTDTGGSIRGPSTANGVVGLKPTHGLVSRDGIIPLALSFDTGGPLARHVADIAAVLSVVAGPDPADDATAKIGTHPHAGYVEGLDAGALKGARIGLARDFLGQDEEVDWVVEAAVEAMKKAGATVVDVRYPKWLLDGMGDFYTAVRWPEFPTQIQAYLATLKPGFPKNLGELIERSNQFVATRPDGAGPNPSRWSLFKREAASGTMDDYEYKSVHDFVLPAIRTVVEGIFAAQQLDAIVYPTSPRRTGLIAAPPGGGGGGPSGTNIANLSGFPDLIVPAGFTSDQLPVGISFFGTAFSEQKLLSLGYSFEQATHARRQPVNTPTLPGEAIRVPQQEQ